MSGVEGVTVVSGVVGNVGAAVRIVGVCVCACLCPSNSGSPIPFFMHFSCTFFIAYVFLLMYFVLLMCFFMLIFH